MKTKKYLIRFFAVAMIVAAGLLVAPVESRADSIAAAYAPIFDANYYASRYPELQALYGNDETALLYHFLNIGMAEGRVASAEFDVNAYRARYADLQGLFGDNLIMYYLHYNNYGKAEGRIGTPGDIGVVQPAPVIDLSAIFANTGYEKATAVLNMIGYDMKAAFNWSAGMTYYGHGKPDMPEVADPGTHWFANFGFDNHKGNCFVMAATFCEMARVMGYAPRQMCGYVPARRGGMTIHSWVEIDVDGQTYVCDPDFTYGTHKNGFMIKYGQPGTWRYTNYFVMHD
ncbi:MAG: transglutaminase-like domain-containing protein [Lachnospiraceae bacterium]|nr:transglutaminase-like domain-containing protein [Lachnospiraceae bacterium]